MSLPHYVRYHFNTQCLLGEGAFYSPRYSSAFWVDIKGNAVFRLHWQSGHLETHTFDEPVCWLAERLAGQLFLGCQRSLYLLNPDTWQREKYIEMDQEPLSNRLNDAKVDRAGRLYFGTMDDAEMRASGSLYLLKGMHEALPVDTGYQVSNGPAFSLSGEWLWSVSSADRIIYRCAVNSDGEIVSKQAWISFTEAMGFPDGITVDSEDCLWVAAWDGGGLYRFNAEGERLAFVPLPASKITSMTFAGEKFDRLLVTSANIGMTAQELACHPYSGDTFILDVGVKGVATTPCKL
ncbi:SMP-30/gluconolactonase/LRE family protein [Alteromonas sp. H39]|uniref:SMP-30/gluconolactonase/LRE family protein n=1 Tax=Alteromonas sp. H39 TaxID=3389876 RepID=UPI0039DF8F98